MATHDSTVSLLQEPTYHRRAWDALGLDGKLSSQLERIETAASGLDTITRLLERQHLARQCDADAAPEDAREALNDHDEGGLHDAACALAAQIHLILADVRERLDQDLQRATRHSRRAMRVRLAIEPIEAAARPARPVAA